MEIFLINCILIEVNADNRLYEWKPTRRTEYAMKIDCRYDVIEKIVGIGRLIQRICWKRGEHHGESVSNRFQC